VEEVVSRSGRFLKQPEGYVAFVPSTLPPEPPLVVDAAMISLLSHADRAVGRLDGVTRTLPNPDLFLAMYVRREAVLSSQIEGTQSTLEDVLSYELDPKQREVPQDVEEVVNYVRAMNYGLERLATLPLSLRLIREIHAELLRGARGADRMPGRFRETQNWIGPEGASIVEATFVPPPVAPMTESLVNLESFFHGGAHPPLIACAMAHAQFETIHPFLDGNGRVGRLLITFQLVHAGVLHRPLLYLSHYFKRRRAEYYDRLMAVREDGNWEAWTTFFLRGVAETAEEATETAEKIVKLQEEHRTLIQEAGLGMSGLRMLELLFQRPLFNVNLVRDTLDVAYNTARRVIDQATALGIVEEVTGARRFRVFRYTPYWRLLEEPQPAAGDYTPPQITETAR